MSLKELKESLASKVAEHNALVEKNTAAADRMRTLTIEIRSLRVDISEAIAHGAGPCPTCGAAPKGVEQPRPGTKRGESEYEVGCPICGWFIKEEGGLTAFNHAARGGILPSHAVDAWNLGSEYWVSKPVSELDDTQRSKLRVLDPSAPEAE